MALTRNYANTYFLRHWRVCGLWNAALNEATVRHLLAHPNWAGAWQVSPEAYADADQTQANRADLLLSKLGVNNAVPPEWSTVNYPVICYEAKPGPAPANGAGAPWVEVRKQIEVWCDQSTAVGQGTPCWAIGAIGSQVKFWIYTSSITGVVNINLRSRMVPVTWAMGMPQFIWAPGGWQNGNNADAGPALIFNDGNIPLILDWMLNHKWAEGLLHPSLAGVPNATAQQQQQAW